MISITKLVELKPIPVGAKMSYSSAASTHAGVDMLGDYGILHRGERERLHRVLDENVRGATRPTLTPVRFAGKVVTTQLSAVN